MVSVLYYIRKLNTEFRSVGLDVKVYPKNIGNKAVILDLVERDPGTNHGSKVML